MLDNKFPYFLLHLKLFTVIEFNFIGRKQVRLLSLTNEIINDERSNSGKTATDYLGTHFVKFYY